MKFGNSVASFGNLPEIILYEEVTILRVGFATSFKDNKD